MTVANLLRAARRRLPESATPDLDAEVLLARVLGNTREWLLSRPEETVTAVAEREFEALVAARAKGQPVAYLVGFKEFYGRRFAVSPAVLVPRPESELIVDAALEALSPGDTFLDVGTGSGCLAITIALERPDVDVVAVDVSPTALAMARKNAETLGANVAFRKTDLIAGIDLPWDRVVVAANLPYVPDRDFAANPNLAHEPTLALAGGPDGLDVIKRLLGMVDGLTIPPKRLLLEIDPAQQAWLKARSFAFRPDLAGRPRLATR